MDIWKNMKTFTNILEIVVLAMVLVFVQVLVFVSVLVLVLVCANSALRVSRAVTRFTVYHRLESLEKSLNFHFKLARRNLLILPTYLASSEKFIIKVEMSSIGQVLNL